MNNKPNSNPDMEQTDEGLEHYKRLISLSYPQPKKPIAENVM